jgi:hypothetical protein
VYKTEVVQFVLASLRPWNDVIERRSELGRDAFVNLAWRREAVAADRAQATLLPHKGLAPL